MADCLARTSNCWEGRAESLTDPGGSAVTCAKVKTRSHSGTVLDMIMILACCFLAFPAPAT